VIDPQTYQRFNAATLKARYHGMALVEVLDRDRLLLTAERLRLIRTDALLGLIRTFDETGVARMLSASGSTRGSTPEDAARAMREWMEKYFNAVRND
jgi:hypothetical protein